MMQRETNKKTVREEESTDQPPRRSLSMHEDVPTWCDCCSCETEPRWQAVEEEFERMQQKAAQRGESDI